MCHVAFIPRESQVMLDTQLNARSACLVADRLAAAARPMAALPPGQIISSVQWCDYFRRNAASVPAIPWHLGGDAAPDELERIVQSLRGWQLGETSDGAHLLAAARNYAATVNDPAFL